MTSDAGGLTGGGTGEGVVVPTACELELGTGEGVHTGTGEAAEGRGGESDRLVVSPGNGVEA